MRTAQRQSTSDLGTDNFDSSVVEAAWAYHRRIGAGGVKGYIPVEVAAFIAGPGKCSRSAKRKINFDVGIHLVLRTDLVLDVFAALPYRGHRDGAIFWGATVVCGVVPNRWTHKRSTTAICTKKFLPKVVSAGSWQQRVNMASPKQTTGLGTPVLIEDELERKKPRTHADWKALYRRLANRGACDKRKKGCTGNF
jgi:hypothetical protein